MQEREKENSWARVRLTGFISSNRTNLRVYSHREWDVFSLPPLPLPLASSPEAADRPPAAAAAAALAAVLEGVPALRIRLSTAMPA